MKVNISVFITAAASIIFGVLIFWVIDTRQAQSAVAKESSFVLTGVLTTNAGVQFLRLEDPQYDIVCYTGGVAFSCVKK